MMSRIGCVQAEKDPNAKLTEAGRELKALLLDERQKKETIQKLNWEILILIYSGGHRERHAAMREDATWNGRRRGHKYTER